MRTWALAQQKGGSGKSTLAINLAVLAAAKGERVVIIDLDPQRSADAWRRMRPGDATPWVIDALPGRLNEILRMAEAGSSLCIIDVPGRLDELTLAAVRPADLVICPAALDLLNLKPLEETVALIASVDKLDRACGIFNNIDEASGSKKIEKAIEVLESFGLTVASTAISHSPQFGAAYDAGKGVTELPGNSKAAKQIEALWADLNRISRRLAPAKKAKERT
jgi:chromosome partitioning protein